MQNLISITLSPSDLQEMDAALDTLRRLFAPMITLEAHQRRELTKMGDKSEAFCRQTLTVLAANPQIVPPNLGVSEAQADLVALDALRPRLLQLQQLTERVEDSVLALGSDLMSVALEGYGLLKVSGRSESLKGARQALSARFVRGGREPQRHAEDMGGT